MAGFSKDAFVALDWSSDEVRQSIRDCFVTGKWDPDEDANAQLAGEENS